MSAPATFACWSCGSHAGFDRFGACAACGTEPDDDPRYIAHLEAEDLRAGGAG